MSDSNKTWSSGSEQTLLPGISEENPDRKDDAEIDDRCEAMTADGERCKNAVSYMTDGPFCGPHSDRAD